MSGESANAIYQKAPKLASKKSVGGGQNRRSINGAPEHSALDWMVKRYKQMMEYLVRRNQSTCMRYQLARAYWRVIGDTASTKTLHDSILNGDSCIDPATGSEPVEVLMATRFDLADLIIEEFRSSTDQQQKIVFLKEWEEIPDRRLRRNIGELEIFNFQASVMLARMAKKVRPAQAVVWNDLFSFCILSKVLMCLPVLERDALISFSLRT